MDGLSLLNDVANFLVYIIVAMVAGAVGGALVVGFVDGKARRDSVEPDPFDVPDREIVLATNVEEMERDRARAMEQEFMPAMPQPPARTKAAKDDPFAVFDS